ncbi:MAG: DUF2782 domain-containing protein [Magnetococcus sp. YQC-9]
MKSSSSSIENQRRSNGHAAHGRMWSPVLLIVVLLVATSQIALAAEARKEGHPMPAKGPLVSELREEIDPDKPGHVTVIRKYEDAQGNQVREFSSQGAIYQVQVIPANGPTYYLIDPNGDGLFEKLNAEHEPMIMVPQWVFFRY